VSAVVERFIWNGAGINNDGSLTLDNCTVSNNSGFDFGGGIYNSGILTLSNSIVSSNTVQLTGGGGIYNVGALTMNNVTLSGNGTYGMGGGLHNTGSATLDHVTVRGNWGGFGAGLFNTGSLTLDRTAVQGNTGSNLGGGIWSSGTLTLSNSSVSGHTAYDGGAGIFASGTVVLNNSTVSGNQTTNPGNGHGGGILASAGTVYLNNSTVTANGADYGSGVDGGMASVTLRNTILAGNTGPDCEGNLTSAGYNLAENSSGCGYTPGPGDLTDVDPRLFPLIGSPGYHPFLRGSPAIDKGNPAGCTDHLGNPLMTDQRGVPRLGRCDIGAYEYDPSNDPLTYVSLPILYRNYCPDFSDDFSNPASGWEYRGREFTGHFSK